MITKINGRLKWRSLAGVAIVLSIGAMVGQGVLSSLNATVSNVEAQNIDSGTLILDLADAGVGFSASINNLAPGDVVNRYVTLTNSGTLAGNGLTLQVTSNGTPSLITNGVTTRALKLTVTECAIAWNTTNGTCGQSPTEQLAPATIGSLTTAASFSNGVFIANTERFLQLKVELPNQNETTINGNLPSPTIQGGSVDMTYIFDLAQRAAATTNS